MATPPSPRTLLPLPFVAVAVLLAVGVLLAAGAGGGDEATAEGAPGSIAGLTAGGEEYVDKTVTVVGEVDQRYGRGLFALGDPRGHEVIVVPTEQAREGRSASDWRAPGGVVQVTGTVRMVAEHDREALRNDFPLRAGRPAIVATEVEKLGCARGAGCTPPPEYQALR
jgi:hypothetical protein